MKGFTAVFLREIEERRLLALVALLGLVPLVLPVVGRSWDPELAGSRGAVALMLALVTSAVLAVLLGASVVAPELAERRLGFYFHRPIGAGAVWAGKLGAALALAVAAAFAITLPAAIAERSLSFEIVGLPRLALATQAGAWLLGLVLLILASHAVSVMARARSPWLAFDLAGLAAATGIVWATAGSLAKAGAVGATLLLLGRLIPLALLLALLAASAAQVVLARTDLRRAHRVLSVSLWGLLLAAAAAAAGYGGWVLAAAPADLTWVMAATPSPHGDQFAVIGVAAHRASYVPSFVVDGASGSFVRVGPGSFSWSLFSADGSRVAWLEFEGRPGASASELVHLDLRRPGARPVHTPLSFKRSPSLSMALSPDGGRLAVFQEGRLLVYELAGSRLVASVPLPGAGEVHRFRFSGPERVRVYQEVPFHPAGRSDDALDEVVTRILEADLRTGRVETTGELPGLIWMSVGFSPDGERLFYKDRGAGQATWLLADARTGRPLADVSRGASGQGLSPAFLSDGRIALVVRTPTGLALALLDRGGKPVASFPFPGAGVLIPVAEPGPGSVAVALARDEGAPRWELSRLDLGSGASRILARDLDPLLATIQPLRRAQLFLARGGGLVWLDSRTGRQRIVAPRAKPSPDQPL